jgi:hypothetical protein
MGPKIDSCDRSILTTYDIGGALQNWRIQWDVSVDEVFFAVLAGDAAVFNTQLLSQYRYPQPCTNVHAFMVLPINSRMRSFLVHILPHPSGSLGESGAGLYRKIVDILSVSKLQIISIATDGDRGYCPYQSQLIEKYRDRLLGKQNIVSCCAAAFQHETDEIARIWWIADCLHALKCQRCRLANDLALHSTMPPTSASLNATLRLRQSLKDLSEAAKMNDIFAVRLFSVQNLLQLLRAGDVYGADDLTPFVTWCAAISTPDLHVSLRLDLLTI